MSDPIILCTKDEMLAMHQRGEIASEGHVLDLQTLFEVLCEYYGVNPHWEPNDVY